MTGFGILASLGLAFGGVTMTADSVTGYADLQGRYVVTELNGTAYGADASLEIEPEGVIRGEGPCNGFGFTQSAEYPAFNPGAIRSTKRACPDLAAENALLQALQRMTQAAHEGETLTLTDADGHSLTLRAEPR